MAIAYSKYIVGTLPWYTFLILVGVILAFLLALKEEKRLMLPKDTIIDLCLIVLPSGIIGARLYYVVMLWSYFENNPLSILYIWEGGLAIYGGVIGGIIATYFFAKKRKLSFFTLLDCLVPGLLLAQSIGRFGNYFNMEAYGAVITNPKFQFFPMAVLIPTGDTYIWHMATFFYESLWNLLGFLVLYLIRKKQKKPGLLVCWYLLIYGSGRFIIEQLRTDSLFIGSARVSQWLSFALCVLGCFVLLYNILKNKSIINVIVISTICLGLLFRFIIISNLNYYLITLLLLCIITIVFLKKNQIKLNLYSIIIIALVESSIVLINIFIENKTNSLYLSNLLIAISVPLYTYILILNGGKQYAVRKI